MKHKFTQSELIRVQVLNIELSNLLAKVKEFEKSLPDCSHQTYLGTVCYHLLGARVSFEDLSEYDNNDFIDDYDRKGGL